MPRTWRAGPDDAEAVAELLIAFRDHLGRDWPAAEVWRAGVERLMARDEAEYLLGAPDGDAAPAAVAQLRFRHGLWWDATDCLLEDLFVRGDARGAGLGRAMVDAVIARATERGCRRLELDTGEANAAAQALYEGAGFVSGDGEAGRRGLFYRRRLSP